MTGDPTSQTAPPGGIEQAHVIDSIVHDARTDAVTMTMVERLPWDGSELQLFQLQEKFNAYVSFALDGEMADAYPALVGKPVRMRLECATYPTEEVVHFLSAVREQLTFQSIDVEVVITGGSCGAGCGCAE
jgi:hypothetical protein